MLIVKVCKGIYLTGTGYSCKGSNFIYEEYLQVIMFVDRGLKIWCMAGGGGGGLGTRD